MKCIDETDPVYNAALRLAAGAAKVDDVPPGMHDTSQTKVTMYLPDGSGVVRSSGSLGDGYEETSPPETITLADALLFIQRSGLAGPTTFGLWKACIVENRERKPKAETLMSPEATRALREVQSSMQDGCKGKKKTAATLVGLAGVQTVVERMTLKDAQAIFGKPKKRQGNAAAVSRA